MDDTMDYDTYRLSNGARALLADQIRNSFSICSSLYLQPQSYRVISMWRWIRNMLLRKRLIGFISRQIKLAKWIPISLATYVNLIGNSTKPEKPKRPNKLNKPKRLNEPERPNRPEKREKPNRPNKPKRPDFQMSRADPNGSRTN